MDRGERGGQGRDHDVECAGSRDHDGLFVEGVEDVVDQPLGHPRCFWADELDESVAAGFPQGGQGSVSLEELGDRRVVQLGPEHLFQRRVEQGEQSAYPVAGLGGLGRMVLV